MQYLTAGDVVTTWTDRLRLVRRTKLRSLLIELDEVLTVFPPELVSSGPIRLKEREPIALGDGSPERLQWDELVAGARSLPQSAAAALVTVGSKVPGLPLRSRRSEK